MERIENWQNMMHVKKQYLKNLFFLFLSVYKMCHFVFVYRISYLNKTFSKNKCRLENSYLNYVMNYLKKRKKFPMKISID
jgi:hypothetical protein